MLKITQIGRKYSKKIAYTLSLLLLSLVLMSWICALPKTNNTNPNQQIIALSGQLLLNVKSELATDSLELALAKIKPEELVAGLSNDKARKTFWINIYNAYFQILSLREKKGKNEIFKAKAICIAQTKFSLNNIEHGILRKCKSELSKVIMPLSVSQIDFRIHFALNCGAKSCPPIAYYAYADIDEQLELATFAFLNTETEIDLTKKVVKVSKLMWWFKDDFGGKEGINTILKKYIKKELPDNYSIEYKEYDWTEQLKNYK
ncbi:MAG: hypothetical protein ACJAUR_000938 [Ulvibacter sp.]|jgi:hypothetical protein